MPDFYITGVILNWKRPANVTRIVNGWRRGGIVTEAIVWNNNPAERFRHDWAAHLAHRSRLIRACEAWLKGESPMSSCLAISDEGGIRNDQ